MFVSDASKNFVHIINIAKLFFKDFFMFYQSLKTIKHMAFWDVITS